MKKIFIGGSRRLRYVWLQSLLRTDEGVALQERLNKIIDEGDWVLIGDANGADKAVQMFLHSCKYRKVTVYCMDGNCRNNLGDWDVVSVAANGGRRDFSYYAKKDMAMIEGAASGFFLWDEESDGTLINLKHLTQAGKVGEVYLAGESKFIRVESEDDVEWLVAKLAPERKEHWLSKIERLQSQERQMGLC